jgi:hypothetical protein
MVTWNKHDLYAFQVKQGMKKDLGAGSNSEASLRKDETDKKASIQGLSAVNQHPEHSNESNHPQGLCAPEPKQPQGPALERRAPRKSKGSQGDPEKSEQHTIIFRVYALRPCDWDNYRIKYLQDWLIHLGIIPGDAWNQLKGEVQSFKVNSKDEERTEVLIL